MGVRLQSAAYHIGKCFPSLRSGSFRAIPNLWGYSDCSHQRSLTHRVVRNSCATADTAMPPRTRRVSHSAVFTRSGLAFVKVNRISRPGFVIETEPSAYVSTFHPVWFANASSSRRPCIAVSSSLVVMRTNMTGVIHPVKGHP